MKYSIIVPTYNEEDNIKNLIESLLNLKVNGFEYEVIIVDNNSTDNTKKVILKYPVIYLKEKKKGSYAARNKGVKEARGKYVCFVDGDCVVSPDWLYEIDKLLEYGNAEIIAGNIQKHGGSNNIYALYDDLCFLNQEKMVKNNNAAVTANLVVSKVVFDKIGLFNSTMLTGGDIAFVKKATSNGFILEYTKKAIVYHKKRDTFKDIDQKLYRLSSNIKYKTLFKRIIAYGCLPGIRTINNALIEGKIKFSEYIKLTTFSFIVGISVSKKIIINKWDIQDVY